MAPQLLSNQGPVVDGRPLPLTAPGQFHHIDAEWLVSTSPKTEPATVG